MRNRTLWILVLVLCALPSFAKSFTPKKNTRADIKAYVQHAAKVVAKSGPSCKTFEGKEWRAGDYYVFVIGPDDKTLCHPKASLIGKPTNEIVDEKGRHVGNEIAAAGKKKGGGRAEHHKRKHRVCGAAAPGGRRGGPRRYTELLLVPPVRRRRR